MEYRLSVHFLKAFEISMKGFRDLVFFCDIWEWGQTSQSASEVYYCYVVLQKQSPGGAL